VSYWRLLAERPAFDSSVPLLEVLRPLVLGSPQIVGLVVLHDPAIPSGDNWLHVFEVTDGEHPRFLHWISDARPATSRFYVPAAPAGTGFRSEIPLYEGHWRSSVRESSELPWPKPDPQWRERATFLARLDRVELTATRIVYRGFSMCRLCGRRNGHESFRSARWEWPAGFRHYIAEHDVHPSPEFEDFINNAP
jgi:hypothetical protein